MKALQNIPCIIVLILSLIIPASSQTKGMRIVDPRTNEVHTVKGYENSYAVCIGIDEYTYWPQLSCAVSDAEAIQKRLMEHGFAEVRLITNEEATRDGILKGIAWLGKTSGKEDRVVIYFSGHGETRKGRRGETGYIIPVDCPKEDYYVNAISMAKIRESTKEIDAKHILYLMDCCYSGIGLMVPRADEEFMIEMTKDPCVYMITAGKAGEQAIEISGHGIFTSYILRGLDGEADHDKNGVISGTELGQYSRKWVSHTVKQSGRSQTPQFGRIDGEGEIVFVSQKEPEEPTIVEEVQPMATLAVNSEPEGASVYVDGQKVGETPCTVEIDAGGAGEREVSVAVSKDGHRTKGAKVKLVAGKQASWTDIRLEELKSEIDNQKSKIGMVLIPAGEFLMGSNDGEDSEKPVHTVYLNDFYMDIYEVTNAQYRRFVQATGHREPEGYGHVNGKWQSVGFKPWSDSNFSGDNQPVVCVSWEDAKAYCDWAGKRLPTEAEWEKAARGGLTGKKYIWGDAWPPPRGAGNFADKTAKTVFSDWSIIEGYDDGYVYPAPVGSFDPNGYGLYDMAGNVWEWCADWYDLGYYAKSPKENPTGPSYGKYRVLRGGSWSCYGTYYLPAASRYYRINPTDSYNFNGFRGVVARD
jgi:sulfatase modifying factor 1